MKILFISPVPVEGAGCRFRIWQYLPYLKKNGIKAVVSPFLFKNYFDIVYYKGKFFQKLYFFLYATLKRIYDLSRAWCYDLIFIYRESYPIGPPIFEYIINIYKKPIIFDFDDAIFLLNVSQSNKFLRLLRDNKNATKIIKMSKKVIAGNDYLEEYALKYNKNVNVIPTPIDTDVYVPENKEKRNVSTVVIGWTGTITTQHFLKPLESVFQRICSKYRNVCFKVIGNREIDLKIPNLIFQKWTLQREVEDLRSFDIGIMPMPDNKWTRGKCGFKALLYMSLGIPVVCSSVGVNRQIIQDGVNGFLAESEDDWIRKLSLLIEDQKFRQKMSLAGRKTVEEKYSLKVNSPVFLEILKSVYNKKYSKRKNN